MADLNETTLAIGINSSQTAIALTSTTNVSKGDLIYLLSGEALYVRSILTTGLLPVLVQRGAAGTQAQAHAGGTLAFTGSPGRFYSNDPVGAPPDFPANNPWVNTKDRRVWRAQGDQAGPGLTSTARAWQQITSAPATGALGVRSLVSTPALSGQLGN